MEQHSIDLSASQDAADLYRHNLLVKNYWADHHKALEENLDYLVGKQWTPEELELFRRKKKAPVVFNLLKASERTVVGLFIQNKYDVTFSPFEPGDQDLADVLGNLYAWTAHTQRWQHIDQEVFRLAWAGGVAYQEVYVDVAPGREPVIRTQNLNPFAVYWDPDSRILISREDAEFVDRDTWLAEPALIQKFAKELGPDGIASLKHAGEQSEIQKTTVHRDRSHLNYDQKNGRFRLIERLYKTRKTVWYMLDQEWRRTDIDERRAVALQQLGQQVYSEEVEVLNLAILCPAWSLEKYLYNGPYHCQPRNPTTGKIIWPILEMVAESLNGQPNSFVENLKSANKLVNSMISNVHHAAKHQSSSSLLRRKGAFSETNKKDFDKHHSDGDRVFEVEEKFDLNAAVAPIPKGEISADNYKGLELALTYFREASSTPPALQGMTEQSGVSGVLNAQRIEQAFVQLQPFIANWRAFLHQRANLAYFYWREYWTYEKTVRILEKKEPQGPDFLTINQEVPATDWMGRPTGGIQKVNDITSAVYDIIVEDSYRSPTYRFKTQQQISELMQSAGVQADPALLGALFVEFIRLSDASQDLKDFVKQHSAIMQQRLQQEQAMQQQQAQMQMQGAQLEQASQMQQLAQAEAEQTFTPPAPLAPAGVQQAAAYAPTAFTPPGGYQ